MLRPAAPAFAFSQGPLLGVAMGKDSEGSGVDGREREQSGQEPSFVEPSLKQTVDVRGAPRRRIEFARLRFGIDATAGLQVRADKDSACEHCKSL